MGKEQKKELDFLIDKLTNSIENVTTGDSFQTVVSLLTTSDLKAISRKNDWEFDWKSEFKQPEREIYKLTIAGNTSII